MNLLLVAIGGAIGSVLRALLSMFVARSSAIPFPLGTFIVNVAGCLVFGLIVGAAGARAPIGAAARAFLLVGLLGGFTTFSTFAFESVALLEDGRAGGALINVAGQTIFGLAAMWLGARVGGTSIW